MFHKLFRSIVAIGAGISLLILASGGLHAADQNNQHFWTEVPVASEAPKAQTMPDFVDLASKLSPAVVNISTDEEEAPEEGAQPHLFEEFPGPHHDKSLGSGFIISKDGYILTNDHVVENPGKITVTTQDGRNYIAKLIGHDSKTDVALLKIQPKHDLAIAPLGDSDNVRVGEWVMAIGNPFGFDHSVTVGVVSAKGRFIPSTQGHDSFGEYIQTDASINPGNSGGPLIDQRGEVVGVNAAIYTRTGQNMGIGFAIPVNMVKDELPQLRTAGKVVRGWLGVFIQRMTPDLAEAYGLTEEKGALVSKVVPGGPAKVAGVKNGDLIVAYDNRPVLDSRELPMMVSRTPLGHTVTIKIIRDKHEMELPVTITESHETELASAENPEKSEPGAASPYGLHVKDLSPDLARELGLEGATGVMISSVQPGSRADKAGLRARDVILEVNQKSVKDVTAYQEAIKSTSKGKPVLLFVRRGDDTIYIALKPEA
jgi:serine protease Do